MSAVLHFSTDDISPRHRLAVCCETVFVANLEGTYRRRIPRDAPALVLLKRYLALLEDVPAALADPGLQRFGCDPCLRPARKNARRNARCRRHRELAVGSGRHA